MTERLIFPYTKNEGEDKKKTTGLKDIRVSEINKQSKFATRLRELRNNNISKVTQVMLAQAIGVTKSTINQYENGDSVPDGRTIVKLAQFYGVSTDYILCESDVTSPDLYIQAASDDMGLNGQSVRSIRRIRDAGFQLEQQREDAEQYPQIMEILNALFNVMEPWDARVPDQLKGVFIRTPMLYYVVREIWVAVFAAKHVSTDKKPSDDQLKEIAETGRFVLEPKQYEKYAIRSAKDFMNSIIDTTVEHLKKKYIDAKEAPDDGEREQG